MRELIREMVHYRNEHADDAHLDPKIVSDFEEKYQEILEKAKEEYILHEQVLIIVMDTTCISGCRNIKHNIYSFYMI